METMSELLKMLGPLGLILELIRILGLPALIFIVWYVDRRDMQGVLRRYGEDMQEMRDMYKSNVRLVEQHGTLNKNYERMAQDLQNVVIMNTQAITTLNEIEKSKRGQS